MTQRVVIHHQNAKWAQTKKRCTLKKEILIFGYVKIADMDQKIELKENGLRKKQRKHTGNVGFLLRKQIRKHAENIAI